MNRTHFWTEILSLRTAYLLRRPVLLFLILFVSVMVFLKYLGVLDRPGRLDPSQWAEERVYVTGTVVEPPEPNPKGLQVILECETLRLSTETVSSSGKILIQFLDGPPDFAAPGDRISTGGLLQKIPGARIPGTFDYAHYMANRGIYSQMYAGGFSTENLGDSGKRRFTRLGFFMKQHVINIFARNLNAEEATVLSGLVVGSRPRFHPEIKRIFTESGTMHILVASGSNVAFVMGFWFLMVRIFFRMPRRWALASSIPAIWIYVLAAGADAPIVRAGVMTTVGITAFLLSREDRAYHALGLAALAILLPAPKIIFDIGFQMSFLTVFGMIYYLPKINTLLENRNDWVRGLIQLAAAGWSAQVWIGPITLAVFKRFFLISFISNLIIIPMAGAGLSAGLVLALADFIHTHLFTLGPILSWISTWVGLYLRLMISLVGFFAAHPGMGLWVSCPGKVWTVGYYLVALCVVKVRHSLLARMGCVLGIIFLIAGWTIQYRERRPPNELRVTWLDMGRTLTTFIETPEGEKILLNPGPRAPTDTIERTLMPFLADRGMGKLDAVILTGPSSKNTDELESLKDWLKIKNVWIPSGSSFTVGDLIFEPLTNSRSGTAHVPLLVSYHNTHLLLAKSIGLRVQEAWVENLRVPLDLIQARFSDKAKWREEFVRKVKPKILIETGFDSERFPSCPPWKDIEMVVPQKEGLFAYSANSGGKN